MPELPEVETIKTAIDRAIGKATILNISVYNKNLREKIPDDLAKKIVGAKICAYERRAKYILIHLDNKICLIWHLGMSGQIKISSQELERAKHDHVVIETSNGFITYHDARRFGMLTYFDEKENTAPKFLQNLGPEPFDKRIDGKYLYQKLQAKKVAIKVALLDQSIICGIGNIYVSEALYFMAVSFRLSGYAAYLLPYLHDLPEQVFQILFTCVFRITRRTRIRVCGLSEELKVFFFDRFQFCRNSDI